VLNFALARFYTVPKNIFPNIWIHSVKGNLHRIQFLYDKVFRFWFSSKRTGLCLYVHSSPIKWIF
jgi:hypothetical protein